MANKDLQVRYNELKEKLENFKSEKIKLETVLESLQKQEKDLENKIKSIASTDTVEEAEKKLSLVEKKLESLIEEAEGILDEQS